MANTSSEDLHYIACLVFTVLGFLLFMILSILALLSLAPAIAFTYFCLRQMFNKEVQTTFDVPGTTQPIQPEVFTLTAGANIFSDPSSIGIFPHTPHTAAVSPFIFLPSDIEAEINAVEASSQAEWRFFGAGANWRISKQKSRFRWAWDGMYSIIKRRTRPEKAMWVLFGGTFAVWLMAILMGWATVGYALPRMNEWAKARAGHVAVSE